MKRSLQEIEERRAFRPDTPPFIREQRAGSAVVGIYVPIGMVWNAPADFTDHRQSLRMVLRKLQFDGKTIKNLILKNHRKSAANADNVTGFDKMQIGVLGFDRSFLPLVERGIIPLPQMAHIQGSQGRAGATATEAARRRSWTFSAFSFFSASPYTASHPDSSICVSVRFAADAS